MTNFASRGATTEISQTRSLVTVWQIFCPEGTMENHKFIAGFRRPAGTENFEADLPAAS
jgi:hypothetical protein